MQTSYSDDKKMPMASSSSQPHLETPAPAYTDEDAKALFIPSAGFDYQPSAIRPLHLPLALPQLMTGIDSPFARAYAPELAEHGIEMMDWLKFCDGLNIAFTASPPLRVVDAAGMIIGFVPYHWAIIAGAAMQTAAQTTAHILSKTLTDRYLRNANENYFTPRGLRVRLCKTNAMRQLVGIDATPTEPPSKFMDTMKAIGNGAEGVGLRLPIVRKIITRLHPAPVVDTHMGSDSTSRRLAVLQGYVLPLDFNVPPAQTPPGAMDKVSALGIKLGEWQNGRAQARAKRARDLQDIRRGGSDVSGMADQIGRAGRRARKAERRAARDIRRGRIPRESNKIRMRVAIEDRKEATSTNAILWIVLLNAEQG
ncbi:hypothetical protein FRB93_002872 [Tulasnella sp. JGI-2019a]|nr:hypothetical protein FRB93_002872 [Tulasnella sp. JGI-2019a]